MRNNIKRACDGARSISRLRSEIRCFSPFYSSASASENAEAEKEIIMKFMRPGLASKKVLTSILISLPIAHPEKSILRNSPYVARS